VEDIDQWAVEVFAGSRNTGGLLQGPAKEAGIPHAGSTCFFPSGEGFIGSSGVVLKITKDKTIRFLAGTPGLPGYADGPAAQALIGLQLSICPDHKGGLYIGGRSNRCIRRLTKKGSGWVAETVAGSPANPGWKKAPVDGTGREAVFKYLHSNVAADKDGVAYIMDQDFLRRITPDGKVETLNPKGGRGKPGDGPLESARFSLIMGGAICFGEGSKLLVADRWNFCVREVDLDAKTVKTVAGPSRGYKDGPADKAGFHGGTTHMTYDPYRKRIYATGADDWGLRAIFDGKIRTIAGGIKKSKGFEGPANQSRFHWCGVRAVDPRPPHDIYFSSGGGEWKGLLGRLYKKGAEKGGE
jgi:hypothetical protein